MPLIAGSAATSSASQPRQTFSRDVDILPEGHRLVNGDARCAMGYQGSLSCHTGEHGFAFASIWGENW
jgi:hypothetical protein